MPAKAPRISEELAARAAELGGRIRQQRKSLRVRVETLAEAAGVSRVTVYRIEKGEPSVTLGAYLAVSSALGLTIDVGVTSAGGKTHPSGAIPVRIPLANYPQLQKLAWQIRPTETLRPAEALSIYERNWRHLDLEALEPAERELIEALQDAFGGTDV